MHDRYNKNNNKNNNKATKQEKVPDGMKIARGTSHSHLYIKNKSKLHQ